VARIYSMKFPNQHPILAFTDFGAAFPSLIHRWLFTVMKFSCLPTGLNNFIAGIHFFVIGVGKANSQVMALFVILSGVVQGCPLASLCFVVAFDPFLNLFDRLIVKKGLGIVRACADDVGCALTSVRALKPLATIFKLARELAGLDIKFRKSTIVPTEPFHTDTEEFFKTWLREHLPTWIDINIAPSAKYLGTHLGTKVSNLVWAAPMSKWQARTAAIAAASAPPAAVSASLYNVAR
jgi:hypothetical protein